MIKMFEDFNEIHAICKKYGIENYTIKPDGCIDVNGSVDLYRENLIESLTELPLRFGRVSGDFDCSENRLTSLKGAPSYVGNNFYCCDNELTSLEFSPSYIGGIYNCSHNKLITLKGAPKEVGDWISFYGNTILPKFLINNGYIKYILANQDDYGIWNKDGTFNELRFDLMMKERNL